MKRFASSWIVVSGALLVPAVGFAQSVLRARRPATRRRPLHRRADQGRYFRPAAGDGRWLFGEHGACGHQAGLITKPLKIDHHRSLLDTESCQTFTEMIVTDTAKPYIVGTRLRVNHDKIAEIEILWTTTGYWLFNAENYLKYSSSGKLGPDSRGKARLARHAGRRRECLPRCLPGKEDRPGAVGFSLRAHRRWHVHRQGLARLTAARSACRAA